MADNTLVIKINGSAKDFLDELDKVKKETESLEKVLTKTAKSSAIAFAAFAGSIALVTKSFADYETALVGVGKTTNIEGKRLENFGKEFQKLSATIPISTNELLGIAQAAGQLGVKGEKDLLKFTETVAKLGVATDLTGEQAATSLTRILNVTGESISTIDNFGSVIVQLGNNFAATESEIVAMATEVSRSTAVFGVTAAEAAGLSAALKSVGVQAQLGGSATGRAFRAIDEAVRGGGAALKNLEALTGQTGAQLQKTFKEDATSVFQAFINGLGNIQRSGGSTTKALEAFGLKGDEILKVLPVLAKNSELVGDALKTASDETKNATALNAEAAKAFATLNSEGQLLSNAFTNLKTNIGEQLAPQIADLLKGLRGVVETVSSVDKEVVGSIATFLKWGAIISGAVASITAFLLGAIKVSAVIASLSSVFLPATVAASAFWVAVTGPIGIAVAGIAAVTAGAIGLYNVLKKDEEPKTITELNKELEKTKKIRDELAKAPDVGPIRKDTQLKQFDDEIAKLEELRKKRIEAANTPVNLARPTGGGGIDEILAPKIAGIDDQVVPFKADTSEVDKKSNENLKASVDEKQAILDEATMKRIEAAKLENAQLKALQADRLAGATDEELAFAQRKQEIEAEILAAKKIKNEEERALALENLTIKHEEELASIEEFEALKTERDLERQEEKAALDAELRELSKEQQALFNEEDRQTLQASIDSQREAEKKAAEEKLTRKIKERNQFLQDEIKYGTTIAQIKQFFNSEEVEGLKSTTGQLVALTNSKNSTLKGIGKAAARTNAAIATAEGAIKAYSSLAGIPVIGPALGAVAAGALVAYGVEQQSQISAMATGGFVPQAQGGARDRVPTMLEPNELVVPAAVAPNFIQSVGNPQSGNFANDDASAPSRGGGVMRLEGDLIQNQEFVSALATQLRELKEFDNVTT